MDEDFKTWVEANIDGFFLAGLTEHPNSEASRGTREMLLYSAGFEAAKRGFDEHAKGQWFLAALSYAREYRRAGARS